MTTISNIGNTAALIRQFKPAETAPRKQPPTSDNGQQNPAALSKTSASIGKFSYDSADRVISASALQHTSSAPEKAATTTEAFTYDSLGQVNHTTTEGYKAGISVEADEVTDIKTDRSGKVASYTYQSEGKKTTVKDIEYNDDDTFKSYTTVDEDGKTTIYKDIEYDENGKITGYTMVSGREESHVTVGDSDDQSDTNPVAPNPTAQSRIEATERAVKPSAAIDLIA